MTTSLDYLKQTGTTVVSDSGDFECECGHPLFSLVLTGPMKLLACTGPRSLGHVPPRRCMSLILTFKDATTNPTLLLAAANKPQYAHLVDSAIKYAKSKGGTLHEQACWAMDRLVCFRYFRPERPV